MTCTHINEAHPHGYDVEVLQSFVRYYNGKPSRMQIVVPKPRCRCLFAAGTYLVIRNDGNHWRKLWTARGSYGLLAAEVFFLEKGYHPEE